MDTIRFYILYMTYVPAHQEALRSRENKARPGRLSHVEVRCDTLRNMLIARFLRLSLLVLPRAFCSTTCESLAQLHLPDTTITAAADATGIPSACRVLATIKPTSDSDIKVEILLPKSGWNGKYVATGNGGWCGSINERALESWARRGYATSGTNTGHDGCSGEFALGHPEKLIDYAYRSEHEMTVKAKAIVEAFYSRGPQLSYWVGCSAGGKQGLMEAQRYPEDFDGISAGAPAADWIGRATQALWVAQAVHRDAASELPAAKYPAIHAAAMAACDALDGVADEVIENPRRCKFDPQALACKGDETDACLTPAQVETVRKIYSRSINPRTGKSIYSGLEPGSELNWRVWGGPKPLTIAYDYFRYVVFEDPKWEFHSLNFDKDVERAEGLDAHRINATNPDLQRFFARGGKLLQYHGWNDPQISPGNSVDYYESVLKKMGGLQKVQPSYRLFMVPGMNHCGGGNGPGVFDPLPTLERWREQGIAPQRIVGKTSTEPARTHPLCPYPQEAVYKGSGSTADESSFVCQEKR